MDGASKKDRSILSGYTESDKIVHFKGPRNLIGQIVKVKISATKTFALGGELLDETR